MNKKIEELLDQLQLMTPVNEDDINKAYIQLCIYASTKEERKKITDVYNELKQTIKKSVKKSKNVIFLTVVCKHCEKIHLSYIIKIPKGKIEYACTRCAKAVKWVPAAFKKPQKFLKYRKKSKLKKIECVSCAGTKKIYKTCPKCKGRGLVKLKRFI